MKNTVVFGVAVVLSVLILSLFVIGYFHGYQKPLSTPSPTPYIYPYLKPTPSYGFSLSPWQANVTQGESLQVSIALTSFLSETATFTPKIQLAGYGNAVWDPSNDSTKVYNATFTQNRIVLESYGNATITMTMNFSQDAQLGRYLFYVSFSRLNDSSVVGEADGLTIIVASKTSPSPPVTPYPNYFKPTPTFYIVLDPMELTVTQGETFHINVTMNNYLNQTGTFAPHLQLFSYNNTVWDSSQDISKICNATFIPEQLVLQQNIKGTTNLTIIMASDAPIGHYLFYVGYDNLSVALWVMVTANEA